MLPSIDFNHLAAVRTALGLDLHICTVYIYIAWSRVVSYNSSIHFNRRVRGQNIRDCTCQWPSTKIWNSRVSVRRNGKVHYYGIHKLFTVKNGDKVTFKGRCGVCYILIYSIFWDLPALEYIPTRAADISSSRFGAIFASNLRQQKRLSFCSRRRCR